MYLASIFTTNLILLQTYKAHPTSRFVLKHLVQKREAQCVKIGNRMNYSKESKYINMYPPIMSQCYSLKDFHNIICSSFSCNARCNQRWNIYSEVYNE